MKRGIIFAFLIVPLLVCAQVSKTINVTTAGTLTSLLTASEKTTVTNLTITGTMNAIDFKCLRDELTALTDINLKQANIAAYNGNEGTVSSITNYSSNEIPPYSFQNKSSLKSIEYPANLSSIGTYSFKNCTGLTGTLNIPATVISLKLGAFDNCSGYSNVVIPNSVQIIEGCAFIRCSGLTGTLTIPKSVVWMGAYAFKHTGNSDFVVEPENQYFSSLNGVLFDKNKTRLVRYPTNKIGTYTIPNTVNTIGISAFAGCENLIGEIVLPNTINSIESSAFENCTKLSGTIQLPETVTTISDMAFSGCTAINNLIIPESVKSIGQYAFYYCISLKNITVKAKTPPAITETSFYLVYPNKIEIPMGTKINYQSAFGWSGLSNYIETATGIEQVQTEKFIIYPNSATDFIRLSGINEYTQVEVYSMSGKLIKTNKLNSQSNTIDIHTLPKGVYLIKGYSESGVKDGRFVKE